MAGMSLRRTAIGSLAGVAALAGPASATLASDLLNAEITKTGDDSYVARVETNLPAGWEAEAGVDFGVSKANGTGSRPGLEVPWVQTSERPTVAWSAVKAPVPAWLLGGEATVRAQVDPQSDTAGVVGSVTHSRALGDHVTASLVDSLAVTDTGVGTPERGQTWEANRSLRLEIAPTGTALIARGQVLGTDQSVHTYLSAEQPLGGGLDLTTSLSDVETGEPALNVGARLNRTW